MTVDIHKIAACVLSTALALINCGSASAHHSYAMFDLTKQTEISGTVRTLEWMNPHVWLWLDVVDKKGDVAMYAFEGTSIAEMSRRNGWTKSVVTSGDKVIVRFAPFKDGRNGGRIQVVTLSDGRVLNAGSGVNLPSPGEVAPTEK
jgi:hypothetical protein